MTHHRPLLAALLAFCGCATPRDDAASGAIALDPAALELATDSAPLLTSGFRVARDVVEPSGRRHVRVQQNVEGIPVLGGDAIVHYDLDGEVIVTGTIASIGTVDPIPELDADSARALLAERLAEVREDFATGTRGTTDLAPPTLAIVPTAAGARLVWRSITLLDGSDPVELDAMIDAHDGSVVQLRDALRHAVGTGKSLYAGTVSITTKQLTGKYKLVDNSRGGAEVLDLHGDVSLSGGTSFTDVDNAWGDGTMSDRATVAVDAAYATALTHDYFKAVHGRDGVAGDGVGTTSRVHYGTRYTNAFWSDSCNCVAFGDGDSSSIGALVSTDIVAHELTHGITSHTAGLETTGEAGALDEATSDIFASLVELSASNPFDYGDYWIGEEVMKAGGSALRYMDKPSRDTVSEDCWTSRLVQVDRRYASGVGNHFFYLLAEGSTPKAINGNVYNSPTCDGSTVDGIGRDEAGQIWYRALTVYLTSTSTYADARRATIQAAKDLYGKQSTEVTQVKAAWTAVGVR